MRKLLKRIPFVPFLGRNIRGRYRAVLGVRRLRQAARQNSPLRIVIGSSGYFEKGWVPTDVEYFNLLDRDSWKRFFSEGIVDAFLAEHVWEHLTPEEGISAARHCYRFLRSGGYIRVAVPDGFFPDPEYIDRVKPGGTGPGAEEHKVIYNHETLKGLFETAGFQVRMLEYFDSAGKFHSKEWDPGDGKINRSARFDKRNRGGKLRYTSIILDAFKAGSSSIPGET